MQVIAGLILFGILGQVIPPPDTDATDRGEYRAQLSKILERERTELASLAMTLTRAGKADLASSVMPGPVQQSAPDGAAREQTLPEIVAARPGGLANLPASPVAKASEAAAPEAIAIRATAARALFDLAMKAATGQLPRFARADACLRLVLERDPDHAEARRLLGYIPFRGGWATPFAADQLSKNRIPHPVYGWVDASWVPHLERKELPTPPGTSLRWLPEAEADALRSNFSRPWQINTEHFQILTNVPLSEAIQFGHKLEALHDLFSSKFADLFGLELPLAQLLRNPKAKPALPRQRHRVFYFARKDEYVQYLEPFGGPSIGKSLGIYISTRENRRYGGVSYFYRESDGQLPVEATLFHEGSHQILFESAGADSFRENSAGYWVFEGLGTYFETLALQEEGSILVGGLRGPRMLEAKRRLINLHETVPLAQFVRHRRTQFNQDSHVHLHYAQAMALTVYLLHGKGGLYREGFLDYVRDSYKGRLTLGGRSLEERIGISYEQLEAELLEYLSQMPDPAARRPS